MRLPLILTSCILVIRSSAASTSGLMVHGKSPIGAKSATKRFISRILARFVISVISATTNKAEVSCHRYKTISSTARGRFPLCMDRQSFLINSSLHLKHTRECPSYSGLRKVPYRRSDPGNNDLLRVITVYRPFNRLGASVLPLSLISHLPQVHLVCF